jgi:hypothetical protein
MIELVLAIIGGVVLSAVGLWLALGLAAVWAYGRVMRGPRRK